MRSMTRFHAWRATRKRERDVRAIRSAKLRYETLLENTPRYWRAAVIGSGAMIDCGSVTKSEAIAMVTRDGGKLAYVDLEEAFLALQGTPDPGHDGGN